MISNINFNTVNCNRYKTCGSQRASFAPVCDTVSFGNKKDIENLEQKRFQEYLTELYSKSPEKYYLLLKNEPLKNYLDDSIACFSDEFASITKEDAEVFKEAVDNLNVDDIKDVISAVNARYEGDNKHGSGKQIAKGIVLYNRDKEGFYHAVNSPVVEESCVYSSGYSKDLFKAVCNYPMAVADNLTFSAIIEIEKAIKEGYNYEGYTACSDTFKKDEKNRAELSKFLSTQKIENDITVYRGERTTFTFDSVPVNKNLERKVRLAVFLNPKTRKAQVPENSHQYEIKKTGTSIYRYIQSKEKLTLADAMMVAKYGNEGFINDILKEINKAEVKDNDFKSYTLSEKFAKNWAKNRCGGNREGDMAACVSKTTLKKGTEAGYDPHGGKQYEFIVNDNDKKITFSNAKYDKKENVFYFDSVLSPINQL